VTFIWKNAKSLFAVNQEQSDLLGRTANAFFQVCQATFFDGIILNLSRLTDPLHSMGKDNLCLERLLLGIDKKTHPDIAKILYDKIETAKECCRTVRSHRMRKLAHLDLRTALNSHPEPLPKVTIGDIDRAVKSVQDVVRSFSQLILTCPRFMYQPEL